MRVVFASGGTGGHIYPALALADEMKARYESFRPLFVGTRSGLESEIIPGSGYRLKYIVSGPMRGRRFWGRIGTLFGLSIGVIQAMIILFRFKPDLVIGFGGYASASVVIAAILLRKRIVLQEQNSIPGITNRLLAGAARRIYIGFEYASRYFRDMRRVLYTGNPLRGIITESYSGDPFSAFGLNFNMPTILVFGGSQGAHSLNRAALEYFRSNRNVQGIMQTGRRDYESVRSALGGCSESVFVTEYIGNIREAYEAADVVLARAGALSVSEIAAVGIPSILVPYPFSADDHQRINAAFLEEAGGAVTVEDSDLSGEKLGEILGPLLENRDKLERMKAAVSEIAPDNAAARIVDDIENILESERG